MAQRAIVRKAQGDNELWWVNTPEGKGGWAFWSWQVALGFADRLMRHTIFAAVEYAETQEWGC